MVSSSVVLLPLYLYPYPASLWKPLTTALSANPTLTFQTIVDVDSGPGAGTYPNSDYVPAIASINAHANNQPICYVHTSYARAPIADVKANITKCAGWAKYAAADIHMTGIFFDEMVYDYNTTTVAYMTEIADFARDALGEGNDTIVFNPGTLVDERWFDIADYILVFENSYSAYSASVLKAIPAAVKDQAAIMIYGFTGTAKQQTTLVNQLVDAGIGGVYITTQTVYSAFSSLWTQFCSSMAAAVA